MEAENKVSGRNAGLKTERREAALHLLNPFFLVLRLQISSRLPRSLANAAAALRTAPLSFMQGFCLIPANERLPTLRRSQPRPRADAAKHTGFARKPQTPHFTTRLSSSSRQHSHEKGQKAASRSNSEDLRTRAEADTCAATVC